MSQFMQVNSVKKSIQLSKLVVFIAVAMLTVLYFIFLKKQYINLFFESQFLHIDFLRDISQNQLTAKGFFTVYGEHLFPGYNLILAANYYLLNLWGGFDSIIYALSLLATIVVVVIAIYSLESAGHVLKSIMAVTSAFLLLSTTNNPQWGMALAAAIGVALFVLCIHLMTASFENATKLNFSFYFFLILVINFFLGGYTVGAVASIFSILIIQIFHQRMIDLKIIKISFFILACLILYIALDIFYDPYSALSTNKPTAATFDFITVGKFLLIMGGASVIGRAFFEQTQNFFLYYLCGAILFFWSAFFIRGFIKNPKKGELFFVGITIYSIANILVVSLFRFKNGLDGALGQWYNVHTHFLAVAVLIYLFISIKSKKNPVQLIIRTLSIIIILTSAIAGYYSDWKKSPYVPVWKEQFLVQVPMVLAFPELIANKDDVFNTMLWKFPAVKAGIDFLYEKNLWIFQDKSPLMYGVTNDNWMEGSKNASIVCPVGTTGVSFDLWRPAGWPESKIVARYGDSQELLSVDNRKVKLIFTPASRPVVLLDSSDVAKSNPMSSQADERKLVALISKISCDKAS